MKRRSLGVARRRSAAAENPLHSSTSQTCPKESQGDPSSSVVTLNTRQCSESDTDVRTTMTKDTTMTASASASASGTGYPTEHAELELEDCSLHALNSHERRNRQDAQPLPELDRKQSRPTCMPTFSQQSLTYSPRTFRHFRCGTSHEHDNVSDRAKSTVQWRDGLCISGVSRASAAETFSKQSTPIHKRYVSRQPRKRFRHDDFKSPMRNQQESKPAETAECVSKETEFLQQTAKQLEMEITSLINEGYSEDELQTHIEKMHEYNELKDTGQMLLGKIALVEGVTTKDLYERFDLSISD